MRSVVCGLPLRRLRRRRPVRLHGLEPRAFWYRLWHQHSFSFYHYLLGKSISLNYRTTKLHPTATWPNNRSCTASSLRRGVRRICSVPSPSVPPIAAFMTPSHLHALIFTSIASLPAFATALPYSCLSYLAYACLLLCSCHAIFSSLQHFNTPAFFSTLFRTQLPRFTFAMQHRFYSKPLDQLLERTR